MSSMFLSPDRQSKELFNTSREYSPGPGAYEDLEGLKQIKPQSPEWTFAQSDRPGIRNSSPGPGAYEITDNKPPQGGSISMGGTKVGVFSPKKSQAEGSPGPGAYDGQKLNKPTVYSIGNKIQGMKTLDVPGPGSYNLSNINMSKSTMNRSNGAGFGSQSKRDTMKSFTSKSNQSNLGPGAYSAKHDILKASNPTFSISKQKRGISSRDLSPGPGAYDGQQKEIGKGSPQIAMKGRPQTAKPKNVTPGPGAYDKSSSFTQQNSFAQKKSTIAKAPRQKQLSRDFDTQGPGAYNPNHNALKSKNPCISFSSSKRKSVFDTITGDKQLGPGTYEVQKKKAGPSFSMRGRSNLKTKDNNPGPGMYNPDANIIKDKIQASVISNVPKPNLFASKSSRELPGPGNYNYLKKFGEDTQKVTIRGKPKESNLNDSPGPGEYDVRDALVKSFVPSYRQGSSKRNDFVSKTVSEQPGPGMYYNDNDTFGKNAPSITIRGKPEDKSKTNNPGPGQYDPNAQVTKDKIREFRMPSSKRQDLLINKSVSSLPGPGMYDSPIKIGKGGPQFTIQIKHSDKKPNEVPGPGSYDAKDNLSKDKTYSCRIGSSSRPEIISKNLSELPGPGTYTSTHKSFGKDAIAVSIRGKEDIKLDTSIPGPGQYDPLLVSKDRIVAHKIVGTKREDFISKMSRDQPGPGNYETESLLGKNCPNYTIRQKPQDKQDNLSPGPGTYEAENNAVKDRIQSAYMPNSSRGNIISKEDLQKVGPGNYEAKSSIGQGPHVSIRGRPTEKVGNGLPGPGNYNPDQSPTKDKIPAYKMGNQTQRADFVSKDAGTLPGPGNYLSLDNFGKDAITFSIRGKSKEKVGNDVPGPGNYNPDLSPTKDKIPAYKMNNDKQRSDSVSKEAKEQPGPGNYEKNDEFGKNVKSFQIGGKPNEKVGNGVPGPGNYNTDLSAIKDRVPAYKMNNGQQRSDFVSKEAKEQPGPGNYDKHDEFGKNAVTFSIRGKSNEKIGNGVPGPGEYNSDPSIIKDKTISYRLPQSPARQEFVSKDAINSPGPGKYESPSKLGNGPSYRIGEKANLIQDNNKPGPGTYDPQEFLTKDKIPNAIIGKTNRSDIISKEATQLPGPGIYNTSKEFGQDAFAAQIKGRPVDDRDNGFPGPGSYDQRVDALRSQTPSFQLGKSRRDFLSPKNDNDLVGPGFYDVHLKPSTPAYTIQGKYDINFNNGLPGPGYYEDKQGAVKSRVPEVDFSRSPDRPKDQWEHTI